MRHWRVRAIHVKVAAAIGLAAVLGMASLAAASPGRPTVGPPTEHAPGRAKVDPVPSDPEAEASDGSDAALQPPADDPANADSAEPDEPDTGAAFAVSPGTCLTHGQRVAAIAHSTPPGPGHGAAVSAVARDHTGECAHTDAETEDPAEVGGDDLATPPGASPAPAASVAPEQHGQHGPRHDTGGSEGSGKSHGHEG